MNLIECFPIPVFYRLLGSLFNDLNDCLVSDIELEVASGKLANRSGGNSISQTTLGLETRHTSFNKLRDVILSLSNECLTTIGVKNSIANVHGFWGNINQSDTGFHMPHSHVAGNHNVLVGVYYPTSGFVKKDGVWVEIEESFQQPVIKSESNPAAGSLALLDPLEFVKTVFTSSNVSRYPYFGNPICFKPQKSLLIVFPTYLPHMTIPNNRNDFKRVSISFSVSIAT